ncbi:FAD:protein FMN transferase [soil metagenome]
MAAVTQTGEPVGFLCHRFSAMGGQNELQIHAQTAAQAHRGCAAAVQEVMRLEAGYSRYRPDSLLSRINTAAGKGAVALDGETAALMAYADTCFKASGGLFDITSGVLRKAWDFSGREGTVRLPRAGTLAPLLERVGWQRVQWDGEHIRLPEGMELDFGGIAKEYAADRASAVLVAHGIQHGLVNLAGDIRVIGPRPAHDTEWLGGRAQTTLPWHIGIRHPRREADTLCTVAMDHGALATSGDYERYIEIDGRRYCHILNPRTGIPVEHWQSVSVIAPLCIAAGSTSTIAMLMGAQAPDFLYAQQVSYLAVNADARKRSGQFGD